MKKTKIKKPEDVMELFHYFANKILPECSKSGYNYTIVNGIGKLWRYSNLLAIVNYKKKYLIHNGFDFIGAFGNGHSVCSLIRAFKEDFISINSDYLGSSDDFIKHLRSHIFNEYYLNYFKQIIVFKELKYGSSSNSIPYYDLETTNNNCKEKITSLCRRFKVKKSNVLNFKFKYDNSIEYWPKGWRKEYTRYRESFSLNDIIKDKLLTKEEKNRLEYIRWIVKLRPHVNRSMLTISRKYTWEDIYNNIELRKIVDDFLPEFIERKKERDLELANRRRLARERVEVKRREELEIEYKEWLSNWYNYKGSYQYRFSIFPVRLRTDYKTIDTTLSASVPFDDARALYNIFKKYVDNKVTGRVANRIGNYVTSNINKDEKGFYIVIGCHYIYEEQINEFIKHYKLDW